MPHSHSLFESIFKKLGATLSKPNAVITGGILSVTLALPEWFSSFLPLGVTGYRYYACPESKKILLGIGNVVQVNSSGAGRLRRVQQTVNDLKNHWIHFDPDGTGLLPHALLAFAFDPDDTMPEIWEGIPNTLFEVPAVLFQRNKAISGVTFTCRPVAGQPDADTKALWQQVVKKFLHHIKSAPEPTLHGNPLNRISAHPEEQEWLALARQAKADISAHILDKVVLARHIRVQGQNRLDPAIVMELLRNRYPNCIQIAMDMGNKVLVAASPERLAVVSRNKVTSEAVAGTARRVSASSNQAQDSNLNLELMSSIKGRHEHALVVSHMAEKLRNHCSELIVPSTPEILHLRFIYHLRTVLMGDLKKDSQLLAMLEHLHPTPAVGGAPTDAAVNWLRTNEPVERGWYSGILGWMTPGGEGEFAMILRCALLKDTQADLFAGAGIVEGSEPVAELEETWFKLQTLLDVLQDV